MRPLDWLQSFRGAFSHPVRAMLTLLGLMIGSGSIVLLACLLASAEKALLAADQNATDNDLVEVRGDDVPVDQKEKTRRELSRGDEAVLAESGQAFGGAMVSTESRRQGVAYVRERRKNVGLVSGMPKTAELYRLKPAHGRFLTEEDLASRRRVVVIGDEVFRDLYDSVWDGTEKHITVDAATFVIVGVLEHKAYMGSTTGTWIWDRKVVLPETTYDAMFAPTHEVSRVFVRRAPGPAAMPIDALRGLVRSSILRRHFGVENFKVLNPNGDKEEQLIMNIIEGLLLGTGLLAMLASGINIMNVMLVTVTERTKEIGIRVAMGARRGTILGQFVAESAVLALFGGLLGVLGGLAIAWLGAKGLQTVFPAWPFLVAPWSLGLGLGLAIVTGVVFGLFPAWRASRLDPIAALRFD